VKTVKGIQGLLGAEPPPSPWMTWRQVLVADDDPAMLRLMTAVLDSAGYDVALARDGEEARECMSVSPPDFLLTDWKMPRMNGVELCRWVRQTQSDQYIYVILFSGRTQTRHKVEAIAAGADDFFSKPFQPGELLACMEAGSRILERERLLNFLTRYDQLTGLLNRRSFFLELDKQWRRTLSESCPLACVMADLDHFKGINDEYGHFAGDEALKAVGAVLRGCAQDQAIVGRFGGEEFAALLCGAQEADALAWAEQCRSKIADTPVFADSRTLHVTASFGAAQRSSLTENPMELLRRADEALFHAKRAGRNRVTCCVSLPAEPSHAP